MTEGRTEVQVRLLFEERTVELFHRIKHLARGASLTLLCMDGTNMAWKTDEPAPFRMFQSSLGAYHEVGSFVTAQAEEQLDLQEVFELLPPHAEVQWAVFIGAPGRRARCSGYVSNCERAGVAEQLPVFLQRAVAYSSAQSPFTAQGGYELQERIVAVCEAFAQGNVSDELRRVAVTACLVAAARMGFRAVPVEAAVSTVELSWLRCEELKAREDNAN